MLCASFHKEVHPMTNVVVLGGVSWNLMIQVQALPNGAPQTVAGPAYHEAAGSTGLGKALALAALGHTPILHAVVGQDAYAERIQAVCRERGVTLISDAQPGPTARHVNLMDPRGLRVSYMLENGPAEPEIDVARMKPILRAADMIFLGITPSSVPLLDAVSRSDARVQVDLHDYDGVAVWHQQFLPLAQDVQVSDEHLPDADRWLGERVAQGQQVALTRGNRGVMVADASGTHDVPAVPATLVDANGAGDMFAAALWHRQSQGASLKDAAQFACAAAALAVQCRDLCPAELSDAEIEARMTQS